MHWKVKTKSGTIFNPGLALIGLSWTPGLVVLSCTCLWLSSICVKRILWIPFLPSHRWGFPDPNKNSPARLKSDFDTLKQFASMQDVSWQPRPQGAFLWLFFWHIYNRFQSWIAFKSQYPHTNSKTARSLSFSLDLVRGVHGRNEGSRPLVVYSRLVSIHFLKK